MLYMSLKLEAWDLGTVVKHHLTVVNIFAKSFKNPFMHHKVMGLIKKPKASNFDLDLGLGDLHWARSTPASESRLYKAGDFFSPITC